MIPTTTPSQGIPSASAHRAETGRGLSAETVASLVGGAVLAWCGLRSRSYLGAALTGVGSGLVLCSLGQLLAALSSHGRGHDGWHGDGRGESTDPIDEVLEGSFPASDPPSWTLGK